MTVKTAGSRADNISLRLRDPMRVVEYRIYNPVVSYSVIRGGGGSCAALLTEPCELLQRRGRNDATINIVRIMILAEITIRRRGWSERSPPNHSSLFVLSVCLKDPPVSQCSPD